MARPTRAPEIQIALLRAAPLFPEKLVRVVSVQLGLSRARISAEVRALVDQNYLVKIGTTRPTYELGPNRRFIRTFKAEGLSEDRVWSFDLAPLLENLPRNVLDIANYGVTEMINNALDHAESKTVFVYMNLNENTLSIAVADEGIGIFRKISTALNLPDERLALLELSKGKLTTAPSRHSGEGIFFTSRVFDRFHIRSKGLVFDHLDGKELDMLQEIDDLDDADARRGTFVYMDIARDSPRLMKDVFDEFSSGPDDYNFAKTIVPVRLTKVGDENLVSRSQAKRLMQRVDRFRSVVLDFSGVGAIGQAFADEIFRVFANLHPEVEIAHVNAASEVQQMIRRAEVLRDEQGGQLPLLGKIEH